MSLFISLDADFVYRARCLPSQSLGCTDDSGSGLPSWHGSNLPREDPAEEPSAAVAELLAPSAGGGLQVPLAHVSDTDEGGFLRGFVSSNKQSADTDGGAETCSLGSFSSHTAIGNASATVETTVKMLTLDLTFTRGQIEQIFPHLLLTEPGVYR